MIPALDGNDVLPGEYRSDLSTFDVDNDGKVELPEVNDPASIDPNFEYTRAHVLKHTITHEMGHAVGMAHNSDSTCLMYEYSNNWSRDHFFSDYAKSQMQIHNN